MARSALDRLSERTVYLPSGCWVANFALDRDGYTRVSFGKVMVRAHRWSYEFFVGPIPEGFTIDHVKERGCVSKACWNPEHLEAVTIAENIRRADASTKSYCKWGHPFDGENTYVTKKGKRMCKTCRRNWMRAHR